MNPFPGLVHTARHTMELVIPDVVILTIWREAPKVELVTRVKS